MKTPAFYLKSQSRLVILILLSAIVALILWSLFRLVKQTEIDERQRMEVWALAQKQFVKEIDLSDDVDPLIFEVLTSENSIPMIVVDENDYVEIENKTYRLHKFQNKTFGDYGILRECIILQNISLYPKKIFLMLNTGL